MRDLFTTILVYLYVFGLPVIIFASLILGIVIICTKEKITKLFGVLLTLASAGYLAGVLYEAGLRTIGSSETARILGNVQSYVLILLSLGSGVFLFLYAKKRYGTKLITGLILIIGGSIMNNIIPLIVENLINPGDFDNPSQFSYLLRSITNTYALVFSIAWLIIFLKNRHEENELKLLWLEKVINVATTLFNLSLNLYLFFAFVGTSSDKETYLAQTGIEKYQIIGILVIFVLNLLMNIYIVVKGRKASKDKELAAV